MTDHVEIDALVERAARRDAEAFRNLYEEFAPRVYQFTLFRVRNSSDAEDIVQRVFVKMIEALPRYEQRGLPFGAWVFRMARNAIIDFERVRRPHEPLEAIAARAGEGPGPDEVAELTFEREQLMAAIETLTPEQQEVVTLRFFGGLTPGEIGTLMGKREGSVRALQFRAMEALRRTLAPTETETAPTEITTDSTDGAAAAGGARPRSWVRALPMRQPASDGADQSGDDGDGGADGFVEPLFRPLTQLAPAAIERVGTRDAES